MRVTIHDSVIEDAEVVSETMREADKEEARRIGIDPVEAVFFTFRHGFLRRTACIDGTPVALWGVCGSPLGGVGYPYLITSEGVTKVSPLTFSRIYKKEVLVMKSLYSHLENFVDATYTGAVRMLRISGFELSEPITINGNSFLRFTMKGT